MLNYEIVEEVRAIREAHAEKFNIDLRAIYDDLRKSEAKHITDGHPYITPPPCPSSLTQHSSGLASLAAECDV